MFQTSKNITPKGVHPVCIDIKFLSTDATFYKNAYGKKYRDIASQAFVYAFMASNVYEKYGGTNPKFDIPYWQQVGEKRSNWKGFGAHIYKSTKGRKRVAIAFEGTDPTSLADWVFGNLNIYWKGQYGDAKRLIDEIVERYPDHQIFTTGHSLGGGLAIHAAFYHNKVTVFAFNSSPRIFIPDDFIQHNSIGNGSKVLLISENDDVLAKFRKNWGTLNKINIDYDFSKFDFLELASNNNNKVVEHGMYSIARGMMMVAASNNNEQAMSFLEQLRTSGADCSNPE